MDASTKLATDAELVAYLGDENQWWRTTAQRLLVERAARGVAPQLRTLARDGATPVARVHALWTLQGLGELTPADVAAALAELGLEEGELAYAPRADGDAEELRAGLRERRDA